MAEAGEIVVAVRIDDRDHRRQPFVGLVMVDDDDVEAELPGFRQRLVAGGAAVDGDQQLGAACRERADRLDVRAIALEDAVGNVDERIEASVAQERGEQRGRRGAVDVVVAEDGDLLARSSRRRRAAQPPPPCAVSDVRVRHQPLDGRIEKGSRPRRPRRRGRRACGRAVLAGRGAGRCRARARRRARRGGRARRGRSPSARRRETAGELNCHKIVTPAPARDHTPSSHLHQDEGKRSRRPGRPEDFIQARTCRTGGARRESSAPCRWSSA